MLNVGFLVTKAGDNGLKIIERRFLNNHEKLSNLFPYYNELKSALDAVGYEYEITLTYVNHDYESFHAFDDAQIQLRRINEYFREANNESNLPKHYFLKNLLLEKGDYHILRKKVVYTPLIRVTIHYPEVNVSNTKGQSIKIYDLFTRVFFHLNGGIYERHSSKLTGLKTTYTDLQFNEGYAHSHLHSVKFDVSRNVVNIRPKDYYFENFCLGSGDLIFTMGHLKNAIKTKSSKEDIRGFYELYFRMLEKTVQHESLEGNPYIKLNEVLNKGTLEYNGEAVSLLRIANEFFGNDTPSLYSLSEFFNIHGDLVDRNGLEQYIFHEVFMVNFNFQSANKYKSVMDVTMNGEIINVDDNLSFTNKKFQNLHNCFHHFNKRKYEISIKKMEYSLKELVFTFKKEFRDLVIKRICSLKDKLKEYVRARYEIEGEGIIDQCLSSKEETTSIHDIEGEVESSPF